MGESSHPRDNLEVAHPHLGISVLFCGGIRGRLEGEPRSSVEDARAYRHRRDDPSVNDTGMVNMVWCRSLNLNCTGILLLSRQSA